MSFLAQTCKTKPPINNIAHVTHTHMDRHGLSIPIRSADVADTSHGVKNNNVCAATFQDCGKLW